MKKPRLPLAAIAAIAGTLSFSAPAWAQNSPATTLGPENVVHQLTLIEVRNLQNESLGHFTDLGIDLANGRIVEVFVKSDRSLGAKIVAVPPRALVPDPGYDVYRLNVSAETFKSAPAVDLRKWEEASQSQRIAATYRLFGQEPDFLEAGAAVSPSAGSPKAPLGYLQRSSQMNLPVGNLQAQTLGHVWSFTVDIPKGRVLSVIVREPGNFQTKRIIPATALSFNAARDALVLDETKGEYASEPRYVFTPPAYGNKAYVRQEIYRGPPSNVALEQGRNDRDIDQTERINQDIRAAQISPRGLEVATLNDRVTVRGTVDTLEERQRIGAVAAAAARLEVVDNQVRVANASPDTNLSATGR